jgi:BirA family biotin operon repressor/biotin-[acetyl-CoA-carboxylase] ligase
MWGPLDVVPSTGSTNADLLAAAAAGAPEGQVLVAEEQTAGRGRLGRSWSSRPGASLTFSVLLRPAAVPPGRRGWLPLLAGVAVASAVRSAAGVPAGLKWPNDVLVSGRKLAGILAEQSPDGLAVVVGIGLNVTSVPESFPVAPAGGLAATSLAAAGGSASREDLLLAILTEFEHWYAPLRPEALLDAYREVCVTLGRLVRVELPAGRELTGTATGIDEDGQLLVTGKSGNPPVPVSAGDVIHVRS